MQILRAAELAIQGLLQTAIDDIAVPGSIPVIVSDRDEVKEPMPYILVKCDECEEWITPGSGIFRVSGNIVYCSHTKETSPDERQSILDQINNFAYDSTAAKLSLVDGFHCHGWHPTSGKMEPDEAKKSLTYTMKYWVYCMAMDNA